ncbi:sensor histidine kinase [Streptomonospora salina]|uniref:Oxygen sensor histidine kinase NreB n=1 Tax=Streptomonospora salina TaxID=104205 RepID=A0A841E9T7_9ACTN|nr:sensor histidine kinase [Streptomonospora salina]MBB5999885.1 signal transduction histidine kinase [Streptomonospora salina]
METVPERDLDLREERLRRLTGAVPYALLAASTVLTLATQDLPLVRLLETLGIVALTAALVWTMTGLNRDWVFRPGARAAFVAALVVMIAVLSTRGVWFASFFGFMGYVYSWQFLLGRWRFAGVTATAAVTVTAYMGGFPVTPSSLLLYLFFVASVVPLVAVFSHLGEVTAERSDERKRTVERLRETIRENDGLHAQLLVQAREAGAHDERERMAREIHDTLAQGFVGIITQLQAAERAEGGAGGRGGSTSEPAESTESGESAESAAGVADAAERDRAEWRLRVANAIRLARKNLAEARRSVHALGPAPLETAPLPDALADSTAEWSRLNGVRADFAATGPVRPLHAEVEAVLLRAVQESLANVAGHAGATRVGVTLSYMEDLVVLDVRDDGAGFEPAPVPASAPGPEPGPGSTPGGGGADGGFGLTSMRQRVARLAGTLGIESEPGAGTAVSAALPAVPREPRGE